MKIYTKLQVLQKAKTALLFLRAFGLGKEQLYVLRHYISGKFFPELIDK